MVVFDSEYTCERCKRRIKKGHEAWVHDFPYGPECARIIRAKDLIIPTVITTEEFLPEGSARSVPLPDIDFERFRTSGISELGEGE